MYRYTERFSNRRPRNQRCGSILIAVLGMVTLLSYMVLEFVEEATDEIKYYGLFYNRDDLRIEAYSMLETALAVINEIREIDHALYGRAQGWSKPLKYAQISPPKGVSVRFSIEDESGKFSLANASPEVLILLFEEMEIPFTETQILTDSLLDWIDEDDLVHLNGGENDYYERLDEPIIPTNAPIQSWEELRLIRGFSEIFFAEDGAPRQYFRQFKSAMSLYNKGKVNVNSASGLVLAVIERAAGYETSYVQDYLLGDDGEPGTEDDRLIDSSNHSYFPGGGAGAADLIDTKTTLLKVSVTVRKGGGSFLVTALVSWSGSNPSAGRKRDSQSRRLAKRGETATTEDAGESLGYPFKILRLVENYRI